MSRHQEHMEKRRPGNPAHPGLPMQQFVNPVSPKNKTPPVTHTSPPSKARRLSTNEKEVKLLLQHTNKEPSKPVDTPEEIVPEIVKQAQV